MSHRSQSDERQSTDSGTRQEPSDYQRASCKYYDKMRSSHSGVYSSRQRMEEEQQDRRYHSVTPRECEEDVRNLATFIKILHRLCRGETHVQGIDFGCGSHWFVDFVRQDPDYRWSAVGYDPDEHAIELAHLRFPQSAEFYRCRNPISDGLPQELSATQTFVFCNAVLQHLDCEEADIALAEMSRVLRPGGICLLIFKCWADELVCERSGMEQLPRILDATAGRVLFFDPTMKEAIDKMEPQERAGLDGDMRKGWRLFHLFPVNHIMETAARHGLVIAPEVRLDSGQATRGVITYRSGKKMPTACVILERSSS